MSGPGLPSAPLAAAARMSIAPQPPAAPSQPREGSGFIVLSFQGLSMSPLGSSFDDSSRKLRGAERPEFKQPQGGTPTDPQFPEAYRSEGRKHCFCSSANVDGFIHHAPAPSHPCPSPLLYPCSAQCCKELLSSILHRGLGMRGLTGVSLPVAKHCKEAADPLFLGSAYKGARGEQPAARRCVATLWVP